MKQVIVMRADLGMRKGKMIAQGAHASMAVVVNNFEHKNVKEWLSGKFKKIVVRVDSKEELLILYNKVLDAGLLVSIIEDSGLTEFKGVPTLTCLAIGPELPEDVDKLTGHLKLL